jgi:hypothetical protein
MMRRGKKNLLSKAGKYARRKQQEKNWIISQFVDQIFCESLTRARKERQIAPQASAGYCFSNSPRVTSAKHRGGREKKFSMRPQHTPAAAKRGQVPHDCKQYDFPSGPRQSLDISKIPAL